MPVPSVASRNAPIIPGRVPRITDPDTYCHAYLTVPEFAAYLTVTDHIQRKPRRVPEVTKGKRGAISLTTTDRVVSQSDERAAPA